MVRQFYRQQILDSKASYYSKWYFFYQQTLSRLSDKAVDQLKTIKLKLYYAIAFIASILPSQVAVADTSSADYIFLVNTASTSCQQIGDGYQEVKSFETDNHIVNICQKDNFYYYLGEAKTGKIDTVFLPANPLPGEMYRASNGNLDYIVTVFSNRATLTIQRNGGQIAQESSLLHRDFCLSQNSYSNEMALSYSFITEAQELSYFSLSKPETIAGSIFHGGEAFLDGSESMLALNSCGESNNRALP